MTKLSGNTTQLSIDIVIKLAILSALLWLSLSIISPFILLLIWAGVLAIALFPLQHKLAGTLNSSLVSATLISLVVISLLVVPTLMLSNSLFDSVYQVYQLAKTGELSLPPPQESIRDWPLLGEGLYGLWAQAQQQTQVFLLEYKTEIVQMLKHTLSATAGTLGSLLVLAGSLIIAAVLMVKAQSIEVVSNRFLTRLSAQNAKRAKKTIISTVRSVASGVIGIAFIQAILAGLGMVVADIPAAGLVTLLVMIVAIAQLPLLIILGPVAAYYFSVTDMTPAVIFLIYAVLVSFADTVLKPMFLGRGMDIPMPVILLGAIGGMLMYGIIGLFVGAVILALSYELLLNWIDGTKGNEEYASTDV